MSRLFRRFQSTDWFMHLALLALMLLGLSAIYSVALSQSGGDFLQVKKQLIAALVGGIAIVVISVSNYRTLRNYSLVLYVMGLLLLVAVLFFGANVRGSTGWFNLGFVSFQPVEFMKIGLIVMLAWYFGDHARIDFGWRELWQSGLLAGLPMGLVLLQPDLGSAFVLGMIWFLMILFAGIRMHQLAMLGTAGMGVGVFAWFFLLAAYQKARLLTFVQPGSDPLGDGYNVNQAMIAVGSGGWIGRGLGFGSQSQLKFLPESQTDFIFAVIAEELGMVGVLLLLGAFTLLFFRLAHVMRQSGDAFTFYLLLGIFTVFFVQMTINIGMNIGLLPVTGLGLPFVSYGGSSLVMMLVMYAVAQSVARHANG